MAPVFDALRARDDDWLRSLLDLVRPTDGGQAPWSHQDLTILECCFGEKEKPILPPVALLSWLIRNFPSGETIDGDRETAAVRRKLQKRDADTIQRALSLLRTRGTGQGWHVLEGATCPDVFIRTPDALVVIEGKRTEPGPTTDTTWLAGRHQMLRHLDAAWEIRGARSVYGFFIVEGTGGAADTAPSIWTEAARKTVDPATLVASLPHRSPEEREGIAKAFIGVATWQRLVVRFSLDRALVGPFSY